MSVIFLFPPLLSFCSPFLLEIIKRWDKIIIQSSPVHAEKKKKEEGKQRYIFVYMVP